MRALRDGQNSISSGSNSTPEVTELAVIGVHLAGHLGDDDGHAGGEQSDHFTEMPGVQTLFVLDAAGGEPIVEALPGCCRQSLRPAPIPDRAAGRPRGPRGGIPPQTGVHAQLSQGVGLWAVAGFRRAVTETRATNVARNWLRSVAASAHLVIQCPIHGECRQAAVRQAGMPLSAARRGCKVLHLAYAYPGLLRGRETGRTVTRSRVTSKLAPGRADPTAGSPSTAPRRPPRRHRSRVCSWLSDFPPPVAR